MGMPEFVSSHIADWPEFQRDTRAAAYDATRVPYAIFCSNNEPGRAGLSPVSDWRDFNLPSGGTDFWVHFEHYHTGYNSGSDGLQYQLHDADFNEILRVDINNGAAGYWLYGDTTENTGFVGVLPGAALSVIDWHFDLSGGNITFKAYRNKVASDIGSPDYTLTAANAGGKKRPNKFIPNPNDTNTGISFSQLMASTTPTLGKRLNMLAFNGVSSTNFDQSFGNHNNLINKWRSSAVQLAAASDRVGFTHTTPALGGTVIGIDGVRIKGEALCGAGGPQTLKPSLRINGSNYDDSTGKVLTPRSYDRFSYDWLTDPDKAAAWLVSDIETSGYLEAGVLADA